MQLPHHPPNCFALYHEVRVNVRGGQGKHCQCCLFAAVLSMPEHCAEARWQQFLLDAAVFVSFRAILLISARPHADTPDSGA